MLQQREAQLAGIIDSAMDAIITLDSDQRIVGWNAAAERMFGSPAAEALGRLHARFLPERYRNNHHTLVESFGATGDTARTMGHQRSLTALRADGTEFPIEASISRKAVNDQILYTAIIRDITERESVAEASRANAARQSFLLRLNDLLLPLADPVAIQLVAVQALGEHLRLSRAGYAEDQGDGETLRLTRNYTAGVPGIEGIYRYDDYSPGVLQEFRAGRTVVRSDIAADPTLTDAEWQAHAMLQLGATVNVPLVRGGQVRAVLFAHQREARAWTPDEVMLIESVAARTWDAVERARAEAALHENLQKYRTLFESIDEGVCLVERLPLRPDGLRDYRYIAMNPAMQAMFGIPDLSGQSIRDNFPDQSEAWYDDYDRVLETGQSMRFERESVPQGLVLEMFVTRLEEGSGQRLLTVMQDVTKRRRAEQELAAGRQQLLDLSGRLVNTQEDERRALAYELHDEIGQQLTALNIALELEARATAAQLRTRMHEAQAIVADLTSQVRRLSLDLRPPMLDDLGLLPTLRWHIERFMQQTGVVVDFKYSGLDGALSPHIAIAAYRIIQEALTNIARHAQTTTVQVGIWSSAKQLKITIEDQGRGFDPATKPPHGRSLGVASMRERAELLGGQFSLDAAPGEGTHIRVSLPLDAADA
jgi:PAS domain S-box-containing protein